MLSNFNSLMQVYEDCSSGAPMSREVQAWLANSLERYIHRDCDNLSEAFGLTQERGGVPYWREAAIRRRDDSLRKLAEGHYADLSLSAQASAIAQLSDRYAATRWCRDRERREMPADYRGTPNQFLWKAFKSGAKMPLSDRRLRSVLIA